MERKINNQRKKSIMFCIVCIMLFLFGVTAGISFAYFSDSKNVSNTLNFGKLKIATNASNSVELTLTGNPKDAASKLAPNDTITITGSVGLEENSLPAYIRMKINAYEKGTTNEIDSSFNSAFMAEMAKIVYTKDSATMQWFVVDNYMYLGNKIESTNAFVYSNANTNTNGNVITLTSEMIPKAFQGKEIDITFTYQAIQSAGMQDASGTALELSGYTQENASQIDALEAWDVFIPDVKGIYSGEYATNYVRGTLNTAYKDAQVGSQMTKSPFNYFKENNAGNYVAFGFYPQTVKAEKIKIKETLKEVFNGVEYYLGSDGYLYEKVKERAYDKNYKYSNETVINQYNANNYQYFKLEPIIWEVKTTTDNKTMLMSVSELTAMKYYESFPDRTISGTTIKPNNYEYSYVRAYLNGLDAYGPSGTANGETSEYYYKGKGLLQIAFTSTQQGLINGTTIDGSATMTNDKLFLLSNRDLETTYNTDVAARIKYPTDYAGANCAYMSTTAGQGGQYWTSSPLPNPTYYEFHMDSDGSVGGGAVVSTEGGVVPALFLNIQ